MRAPTDPYPNVLRDIILARVDDKLDAALSLMESIRFEPAPRKAEKWPARTVIARVYAEDHYHCRYCGEKVILTPVMRLLARLYPEHFPYHAKLEGRFDTPGLCVEVGNA